VVPNSTSLIDTLIRIGRLTFMHFGASGRRTAF
jgi:hypothetical protein